MGAKCNASEGLSAGIFLEYLVYLCFRFLEEFFCLLRKDSTALGMGRLLGRLMFLLGSERRMVRIENLTYAFGAEVSGVQARIIARKNFEHLAMLGVKFFRMRRWSYEKLAEKIMMEGKDNFYLAWAPGPRYTAKSPEPKSFRGGHERYPQKVEQISA